MDTPTQKVKNEFSGRNSQGIYPNLDYFGMILKALQTLLFKIKIHPSLKKTPKILGIQPIHMKGKKYFVQSSSAYLFMQLQTGNVFVLALGCCFPYNRFHQGSTGELSRFKYRY